VDSTANAVDHRGEGNNFRAFLSWNSDTTVCCLGLLLVLEITSAHVTRSSQACACVCFRSWIRNYPDHDLGLQLSLMKFCFRQLFLGFC